MPAKRVRLDFVGDEYFRHTIQVNQWFRHYKISLYAQFKRILGL